MDNGIRFLLGTSVGDNVIFSCNAGFEIQGSSIRQCNSDGNWSGTAPTCVTLTVILPLPPSPQSLS